MIKLNNLSNIQSGARKFIAGMEKGDALLPIILLEAAVTGGRTYHAHKRGGFIEGRERLTEETVGAIFWLGGVTAFNKLGDLAGKKLLGIDKIEFEANKDLARDPLKNYMEYAKNNSKKVAKYGEKSIAAFKFTKIASSILLANAVVGFVVPKINQGITRKYQDSLKNLNEQKDAAAKKEIAAKKGDSIKGFTEKTGKNKKQTSFQGNGVQSLLSIANNFENDARFKLLSTDVGIAGGRAISARNKYERREALFRDISSLYFYLLSRKHINTVLNLIEDGRATRLDPVSVQLLDNHVENHFKKLDIKGLSAEKFRDLALGDVSNVPDEVAKGKIFNNGVISLEDFEKFAKNQTDIIERARKMSELQPKIVNKSILTQEQVMDVYKNGLIDKPELLKEVFEKYTKGASSDPMKFVADKDLRFVKQQMTDYINDIVKKAMKTGENVSIDVLKKANKMNFWKNAFNLGSGFAVSAYFLSTVIPKVQYWITEKQTGKNKFPGVEQYDK